MLHTGISRKQLLCERINYIVFCQLVSVSVHSVLSIQYEALGVIRNCPKNIFTKHEQHCFIIIQVAKGETCISVTNNYKKPADKKLCHTMLWQGVCVCVFSDYLTLNVCTHLAMVWYDKVSNPQDFLKSFETVICILP